MQLTRVDLVSVSTVRQIGIVAARALASLVAGLIVLAITCAPSKAGTISLPSNGSGALSNLSFGTSYVSSRDAPVGTVLQSASAAVGISASGMTCNATKTVSVNGTAVPGDPSTFQTNVPGIGVRFYITSMWANSWVQAPTTQTLSASNGGFAHYTRADLVVTGPVSSGMITCLV